MAAELDASVLEAHHPIARAFSWWALVHSDSGEYQNNILPLGTCADLKEFCQYLHHVPEPGSIFDGRHAWRIAKKHWGYGICFFEAATKPEWEDRNNAHGVDLVCRHSFSPPQLSDAWRSLLLLFVNGELEGATGTRVSFRATPRRLMYKIEVWTRTSDAAECGAIAALLHARLCLEFAVVPRRKAEPAAKA